MHGSLKQRTPLSILLARKYPLLPPPNTALSCNMDYNNYYSPQVGPGPHGGGPPPQVSSQQQQQIGVPQQLQGQPPSQQQQQTGQMMHAPMPQHIRQNIPAGPGPPPPQQQLGHHPPLPPPSMQAQHSNYHQINAGQNMHGHQLSHSSSPHQASPQLGQPHPMQSSPHQHHPPMHMSQPQLNSMGRPPMGPSPVMSHPQVPTQNQHANFIGGPPMTAGQQPNMHHHNQPHSHHPQGPPMHPHHQQLPPPQMLHHPPTSSSHSGGPHPPPPHHPQYNHHAPPHPGVVIGRHSPYFQNMPQTEFRIHELNRRFQTRPILNNRHLPITPLPLHSQFDESLWWERLANDFFDCDATLTLVITLEEKPIRYTIGRTLIPRFFRSYFEGGVTDLSIILRNPKEACFNNVITLECDYANIITNNLLKHPSIPSGQPKIVVHNEGRLSLDFVNNCDELLIKSWRFITRNCREYIDRSLFSNMLPNSIEPVTRQGLTKQTLFYLKMCMIIEPMQDIMSLHKQTKQDPSNCLKTFLLDRYNFRSGDDNRSQTNKRRKRKPSAPNNIQGGSTKKSKSNANINSNNTQTNSNSLTNNVMSPAAVTPGASVSVSGAPNNFALVSQDVMVVGEPSLMGGDFGDDNERLITRMENTQYDPSAVSNSKESDTNISSNIAIINNNGVGIGPASNGGAANGGGEIQSEEASMSPSLLQQRQQQHPPESPQLLQQQQQQNSLPQRNTQTPHDQQMQKTFQQQVGLLKENNNDEQVLLSQRNSVSEQNPSLQHIAIIKQEAQQQPQSQTEDVPHQDNGQPPQQLQQQQKTPQQHGGLSQESCSSDSGILSQKSLVSEPTSAVQDSNFVNKESQHLHPPEDLHQQENGQASSHQLQQQEALEIEYSKVNSRQSETGLLNSSAQEASPAVTAVEEISQTNGLSSNNNLSNNAN